MIFPAQLIADVEVLLQSLRAKGWKVSTAESCTGGLVAALLTSIAGSSDVFERGFVTYSNEAKTELLGVSPDILRLHGAVSAEVARAMAEGAVHHSPAERAISVTGIAGPGGETAGKPVGLVFIGCAGKTIPTQTSRFEFGPIGRQNIRLAAVTEAIQLLAQTLAAQNSIRP